ncbi:hypothetical protein [Corynebacterium sp. A21]|uniref:hypothetical protein n=1 Tax=Corynebacterium sp. A21 TaxID=3457318 RepID=UPI003FD48DD1
MGTINMGDLLGMWFTHPIEIRRAGGHNAVEPGYGEVIEDTPDLPALEITHARIVDKVHVISDELVSTARVHVPAETLRVPIESLVTLPPAFDDRELRVIATERHSGGGLPVPDYYTIHLG